MRRAFTMLEMLIAVSLVGVLTALCTATFYAVSHGWQVSTELMDKMQRTDFALNQVISGLRSMYYPHGGQQEDAYGFVLTDNGDGEDPDSPDVIEARIERLGLRMKAGVDFEVTNINDDPRFNDYWQYYHGLTGRKGVTVAAAKNLLRSRPTLIAAVMVARGEADAMLSGIVGRFHKKLGYVRSVIPLEPRVSSTAAMTGVINQKGVFFFVDTHVQEDPTVEQIAEATLQAAYRMKLFGIEPKVALLSHSNFGSHDSRDAVKMRQVRELLLKRNPKLNVDGEMQGDTAWDEALREKLLPNSSLKGRANLFVLPNLEAANIAYNLVRVFTDGVAIGPILMGISKPVHILTSSATSRRVLNMTAIAAVDAQIRKQMEAERGI